MSRPKDTSRDPFRVPASIDPATGARTWKLWAFITDQGLLLGFSATEAGAFSIPSTGRISGVTKELLVTEVSTRISTPLSTSTPEPPPESPEVSP